LIAQALQLGPGGAQLPLELSWGLGHGFGSRVELLNPEVKRPPTDAQIAGDSWTGALAVDVHFDGGLFELLVVDPSLFPRSNHSAMELCPPPSSVSTKWGELQMVHPVQAGQAG